MKEKEIQMVLPHIYGKEDYANSVVEHGHLCLSSLKQPKRISFTFTTCT